MSVERQELYCHNCGKYVQFDIDLDLNGNHVLECPNCGHEHCRVVQNGKITSERWDSSNNNTYQVSQSSSSFSTTSTYTTYTSGSGTDSGTAYKYRAWLTSTSTS